MLQCRVVGASNVPRMDMLGGSDTFVEAYMRHTQRLATATARGKKPAWGDEFVMPIHSLAHQR